MKKSKYNLSQEEYELKQQRKAKLMSEKEKQYVTAPFNGYCDNTDHPLFSIKVTVDKPWAACYYCSKMWLLKEDTDG